MQANDLVERILESFGIRQNYPEAALIEADTWVQNPEIDDSTLVDWTDTPFVTMDNEGSRDLDQAFFIESGDGGFRLRYAIADAAFYVRPQSALFAEALLRGSTYYTPLRAVPMLPRSLSEGVISLNPHVDRRALVFDCNFTAVGQLCSCQIVRARIHSQAQLTYAAVQRFLDGDISAIDRNANYLASLRLLQVLGQHLIERASERDVVALDRRSNQIVIREQRPGFDMVERQRYATERYNEQLSLICNMEGARLLSAWDEQLAHIQGIYRVHEAPFEKKLLALRRRLTALQKLGPLPDAFVWKKDQSLSDYIDQLPDDSAHTGRVQAIHQQVIMTFRASSFQPEPGRHHALGVESYARFTSPMREVVGIHTHQELLEALHAETPTTTSNQLRQDVIDAANHSRQQQRQIEKAIEYEIVQRILKRDLAQTPGIKHKAVIIGLGNNRIYLRIDKLLIDLKVYRLDLEAQMGTTYEISDVQARPVDDDCPTWSLGDTVGVSVEAMDASSGRFVLHLHPSANGDINRPQPVHP